LEREWLVWAFLLSGKLHACFRGLGTKVDIKTFVVDILFADISLNNNQRTNTRPVGNTWRVILNLKLRISSKNSIFDDFFTFN